MSTTSTDISYAPVPTTPASTQVKGTYAPLPNATTPSAGTADGGIDKETFLKLMVAQVQHQDPMSPTDSSQWMAQMAQFTTVEQLTNLANSTETAQKDSAMSNAVGLIGRHVSYPGQSGTLSGTVQSVQVGSNGPSLTIDGINGIDPSSLTDVG